MRKNTSQEQIAVIQARIDGRAIQYSSIFNAEGQGFINPPPSQEFNFNDFAYRVKPEPLVLYVNVYKDGCGSPYRTARGAEEMAGTRALRVAVKMVEAQ